MLLYPSSQGIVLLAVFMFVTAGGPLRWVDWLIPNAAVAGLVKLVVIIVLITLIFSARDIVAQVRTRAAWRAGDYDLAIRQLHGMSFGRPTARMLELEGLTHSLAGQPAEAEQCLRRALAAASQSGPPSSRRRILGCLAEVVEDLGRLEESRRLRQSAIEMGDPQGTARMGAAESLLAQGIEPQKALDLIEGAMRTTKGQVARKLAAGRWANKAWALAVLGRRKEADEAIQQSAGSAEPKLPAVAAYIHWTIGMALEAMERTTESREHFRIASEQDAKGKYGALALEQLNRANA